MIGYEHWLEARRASPRDKEVQRVGKLKTIQQAEAKARHLRQWLADRAALHVVDSLDAAHVAADKLSRTNLLALDIETAKTDPDHPQAGLNPRLSRIRLVQYYDGRDCYLFDLFKIGPLDWINPLLSVQTVAHNALFEAGHFLHQGIEFADLHDSMLMGRVFLNENKALKDLAAEALELDLNKTLQVSDWNRPELLQEQLEYGAADAVVALELARLFEQWFIKNEPHYREAYGFLRRMVYPIARQLSHGVPFDVDYHNQLIAGWEQERDAALAQLDIPNPNSVKQKQAWLMRALSDEEMLDWPLTDRGSLSTAREVLGNAQHIPAAKPLADYTTLSSRLSNFGRNLQAQLIESRLYPGYQIAGMVTGRFSCRNPNIQNMPRTGFKQCFRAPPGFVFVTGDLSQIELRVAGILSNDEVINEAYRNGEDLHRSMAAKMSGKGPQDITKAERTAAKAVNFGLLFGAGARTLQQQAATSYGVEMSMEQAEEYRELFFQTYPQFHEWQQEIVEATNLYESSQSNLIKLTRHYDKEVYTHAVNFPIQSSAWEVLALAIRYVDEHATEGIHISHHVYDELVLLAPEDKALEAARLLQDAFYHGFRTCFPGAPDRGLVEVGVGRTWDEAGSEQSIVSFKV
ncbi:MAG: DNA polymerase [Gammaproteobacteria bacterium]|jgi:DNA polymerase I-like protein with 3'-5' exonuclease and polymerase domains